MKKVIFYGTGEEKLELHYDQPRGKGVLHQAFEGLANNVERRYRDTQSDASRKELEEYMGECPCPACQGPAAAAGGLGGDGGGICPSTR